MQAVAEALLDRHELTGAEVGRITYAANTASKSTAPDETARGR